MQWYTSSKKKQNLGQHHEEGNPEAEEINERLLNLQKHYTILQKKEEYAKSTLIESQSKWTNFSKDILNISKELMFTLQKIGYSQTLNRLSLAAIGDKLQRYEAFLNNNAEELQNKHGIVIQDRPLVAQPRLQPHPVSGVSSQEEAKRREMERRYKEQLDIQRVGYSPIQGTRVNGVIDQSFDDDISPIQSQYQPSQHYQPSQQNNNYVEDQGFHQRPN